MALESGDTDFTYNPLPSDIETINSNPNLPLVHFASAAGEYLAFYVTAPPFDDIHARRALACHRQAAINDERTKASTRSANRPFRPISFGYNANIPLMSIMLPRLRKSC
jgi:ABC-type transport system substrate-binding protein